MDNHDGNTAANGGDNALANANTARSISVVARPAPGLMRPPLPPIAPRVVYKVSFGCSNKPSPRQHAPLDKLQQMQHFNQFTRDIKALRQQARNNTNRSDYYHMRAIETLGRGLFLLALFASYQYWLLLGCVALAGSLLVKWLLMHHIGHGGYDRIASIPARYHSTRYALGWRRYLDWFDWIKPEAWNHEHNHLHHFYTGEEQDPDLVERNLDWLAQARQPVALKLLVMVLFTATWKFSYYSARTLSTLYPQQTIHFGNFFDLRHKPQRQMWLELFLPYLLWNFALLPALLEWLSPGFGQGFLLCRIGAEILHNVHMFIVIVPNHAGADLQRYDHVPAQQRGGGHFYLRQILGSANYHTGNEWRDLCHMYLNYQIEHHLFPNLSMRQYRLLQPQIKALCAQYGVSYIQQSVWLRLWKMLQIAIGKQQMLRSGLPTSTVAGDEATTLAGTQPASCDA